MLWVTPRSLLPPTPPHLALTPRVWFSHTVPSAQSCPVAICAPLRDNIESVLLPRRCFSISHRTVVREKKACISVMQRELKVPVITQEAPGKGTIYLADALT